jgi:hypothetical protein
MQTSIICLIYRSTEYAKRFYECLLRYTPELGVDADFFFVANDATDEVLEFLVNNNYPHIIADNRHSSDEDLLQRGFARPEYISRVYQGFNKGIRHAQSDEIVLMNSDNFVSYGWLPNLRKRLARTCVVSPVLVQPHAVFPNPINGSVCLVKDFGRRLSGFREEDFVAWANTIKQDSQSIGNPFMPVLMYKWQAEIVGLYPEGNIADQQGRFKYAGDTYFYMKLATAGIRHINSNDSVVYHLQEGELRDK